MAEPGHVHSLSLIGGVPTKDQDLAASLIFLAVYCLLEFLAIFRLVRLSSGTATLARPFLFIQVRIAAYVLRIIQCFGNQSTGIFVAQQVLLSTGTLLIIETLVSILSAQYSRVDPKQTTDPRYFSVKTNSRGEVDPLMTRARRSTAMQLMRVALLAAVALGVYAGTQFGNLDKENVRDRVKAMRIASSALAVAVIGLVIVVATRLQFRMAAPPLTSYLFHMVCAMILMIAASYKLHNVLTKTSGDPFSYTAKSEFYGLFCLPELLTAVLYFGVNMKRMYAMGYMGHESDSDSGDEDGGRVGDGEPGGSSVKARGRKAESVEML